MGPGGRELRAPQQYDVLVGTGGLGSGIYFALDSNATLGREESRGAYLLNRRDFGKLHIISHYVKVLLGKDFLVLPVGRVGKDRAGQAVRRELRRAGIDLSYVSTDPLLPTLFSVCFSYPSGEGGNLTTLNSASSAVNKEAVAAAEPLFEEFEHRGIALVAPEVPLPAREVLLSLATKYDFLRVGSFVTAELREAEVIPLIRSLDLLAINLEEAAGLAGTASEATPADVVAAAVEIARSQFSGLVMVVTGGRLGSWVWDGVRVRHDVGINVEVVNSAGAGDAHLAGLIVALAAGLGIQDANAFATIVSTLKVESEDTIAWGIDGSSVEKAAVASGRRLPPRLLDRLARAREGAAPVASKEDPQVGEAGIRAVGMKRPAQNRLAASLKFSSAAQTRKEK